MLYTSLHPVSHPLEWLRQQNLTPDHAYLDADLVSQPFNLRHPQAADRFRPFGMQRGTRLVSDFLTDHHLSRFQKSRQWLVTDQSGNIVWLCGLRIDNRFAVTDHTKRILALHI